MHVLMTTDVVGGVWDFCCTLSAELTWLGHRVTLLALGEPSMVQRAEARTARVRLHSENLRLEWMQDSAQDVHRSRLLLLELADSLRPDVVHANQFALANLNLSAPVVLTAHSDVLSWGRWTRGWAEAPAEWQAYSALVRGGLLAADELAAVSGFLAGELRDLYRVERRIDVVHNGWPARACTGQGAGRAAESRPHTGRRGRLTLLAGRAWDEAKNVHLAASAAKGWDAGRVVFAGDSVHPDSGREMPLDGPLETLGRLSQAQLMDWLGRARVYASSARYDPFGLLPLQAALAGCALLLSDIPSYRELWDGAAVFFCFNDEADMRHQWAQLLDDEQYAASMARRARQRARERYTPERMAAGYLRLYQQALVSGRQRDSVRPPVRVA